MTNNREQFEHDLDCYLADEMVANERADFERRMRDDPALAKQVELQQSIDASLRRTFAPRAVSIHTNQSAPLRIPKWRSFAVAASLLLAVVGGWQIWRVTQQPVGAYVEQPYRDLVVVYHDEAAGEYEPLWVCETDKEFADSFRNEYGQALLLRELPAAISAVGLSYCTNLSGRTTYLLARVEHDPVLVFVDRLERDRPPEIPAESSLRSFRRVIGSLVLYEVTPLKEPRVLEFFYRPTEEAPKPIG